MSQPGLSAERTRLAWRRTTLAITVVVLLAGRVAFRHGATAGRAILLAVLVAGWIGCLALAHRRITALSRPDPVSVGRSPALLSFLTLLLSLLSLLLL